VLRRRQFLVMTGAAFQALFAWPWSVRLAKASTRNVALTDLFLSWINCKKSAAAVGRRYLELAPGEADIAGLVASLTEALARFPSASDYSPLPNRWVKADLTIAIHRDFEREDVVLVDGWMLARTEARLCALVALLLNRRDTVETSPYGDMSKLPDR
jgi:hypothetical protein